MIKKLFIYIFIFFNIIISNNISLAESNKIIEVAKFSNERAGGNLPYGWEELIFKKKKKYKKYKLIKDNDIVVLKAISKSSSSGLIKKISINPAVYPIIKWSWKITNIYKNGDATKKEGDDYPARIYITFKYDPKKLSFFEKIKYKAAKILYGEYPPIAAINYIWESKAPINTIISNPYTDRVKMIVVESGKKKLNTWVIEERNIYNDYIKAFNEKPSFISSVAIMTDSDNTKESTISFYGDIIFIK